MRKIAVSLMLILCVCLAHAQSYTVVHISGGECQVDDGNGWKPLAVTASLDKNAVLRNTGKPYSEVVMREAGSEMVYKVYLLEDNFELVRFVTDRSKDIPSGEVEKFSCFMMEMIRTSKAISVNVNYNRITATHRDGSESELSSADDFMRYIAHAAGGRLDVGSVAGLSSGLIADVRKEDGCLVITNYGDEPVFCYPCVLRRIYASLTASPVYSDRIFMLEPGTEATVPYEKPSAAEKTVVIFSTADVIYDPVIVSEYLQIVMDRKAPEPQDKYAFCVNIL